MLVLLALAESCCCSYVVAVMLLLLLLVDCCVLHSHCTLNPPPSSFLLQVLSSNFCLHGSGLREVGCRVIWNPSSQSNFVFAYKKVWEKFGRHSFNGSWFQVVEVLSKNVFFAYVVVERAKWFQNSRRGLQIGVGCCGHQ
jgi:hypothetical protein